MLVTKEQLSDYLGADSDSADIIDGCRNEALAYLRSATGRVWTDNSEGVELANGVIKAHVWLGFHVLRGGVGNVDFIRSHMTGLIKQLQYSGGDSGV